MTRPAPSQDDAAALGAAVAAARTDYRRGQPARAAARLRALRGRLDRAGDPGPDTLVPRARMMLTLAAAEFELTGRLDASTASLAEAEELAGRSARRRWSRRSAASGGCCCCAAAGSTRRSRPSTRPSR